MVTAVGADAAPETEAGAGVVEMAGADVVATAGVEGAGEAVADLEAAGGSVDVVDSVVGSVANGGPAENGGLAGDGVPVAGEGAPAAAADSADFGPRCSAGRRTPLQPTAAARRGSRAETKYAVVSIAGCSTLDSKSLLDYVQPYPNYYTAPYSRRIRIRTRSSLCCYQPQAHSSVTLQLNITRYTQAEKRSADLRASPATR